MRVTQTKRRRPQCGTRITPEEIDRQEAKKGEEVIKSWEAWMKQELEKRKSPRDQHPAIQSAWDKVATATASFLEAKRNFHVSRTISETDLLGVTYAYKDAWIELEETRARIGSEDAWNPARPEKPGSCGP
jgi:hypothetical protein